MAFFCLLALFTSTVLAETCTSKYGNGTCQSTSACTTWSYATGHCVGDNSIQCCLNVACQDTSNNKGVCKDTSSKSCSGGTFVSNACPGPDNIRCCIPGSGGNNPGGSSIPGIDISAPQGDLWPCLAKSYQKVAIRGYYPACDHGDMGGAVDTNLTVSYNAARQAGITKFDIYFFPCTGKQPTGKPCKQPSVQVNEFVQAIKGINYDTLWLDIEPATTGPCYAFNLDKQANLQLAQTYVQLIGNTGLKWGIYGNAGNWDTVFPSRDTQLAPTLPLWAVITRGDSPSLDTITQDQLMGGWTPKSVYAKQYRENQKLCGSPSINADLTTFRS